MVDWFVLLAPLVMLPLLFLLFTGCFITRSGSRLLSGQMIVRWDPTRYRSTSYLVDLTIDPGDGTLLAPSTVAVPASTPQTIAMFPVTLRPGSYTASVIVTDAATGSSVLSTMEPCSFMVTAAGFDICFEELPIPGGLTCTPC